MKIIFNVHAGTIVVAIKMSIAVDKNSAPFYQKLSMTRLVITKAESCNERRCALTIYKHKSLNNNNNVKIIRPSNVYIRCQKFNPLNIEEFIGSFYFGALNLRMRLHPTKYKNMIKFYIAWKIILII